MNTCYDEDRPDPAAHLWEEEKAAWAVYQGLLRADPKAKARWCKVISEIERVRLEARWPNHR